MRRGEYNAGTVTSHAYLPKRNNVYIQLHRMLPLFFFYLRGREFRDEGFRRVFTNHEDWYMKAWFWLSL